MAGFNTKTGITRLDGTDIVNPAHYSKNEKIITYIKFWVNGINFGDLDFASTPDGIRF